MTREEAIKIFNTVLCLGKCDCTKDEIEECLKMAIEALKTQPCEDWNAVLDELNRIGRNAFKDDTDYDNLFDFISNLPNVTPQPKTEGARGDIPLQQSVPEMPQPSERTETHECDCISRKAAIDGLHRYFAEGFNEDRWWNSTYVLDAINKVPSIQPQSKEEPQQKTGHWIWCASSHKCSNCGEYVCFSHKKLLKYCPECGARMEAKE